MADTDSASPIPTLIKGIALVVGFPLCLIALMALIGVFLGNVWGQLAIALVVMLALPLFIADRLLPDDDPTRGRGVPSDVLAITWLAIPTFVLGLGATWTSPWLRGEADHLDQSGLAFASAPLRWLAAPPPATEEAEDETEAVTETEDVVDGGPPTEPDADAGVAEPEEPEVPAEVADEPLEPGEVFERWANSVVAIQVSSAHGAGGGTGFFIAPDRIVTNSHVVHDMEKVYVKLKDGVWATEVFLLDEDEERDLALLQVTVSERGTPVVLGDVDEVKVGDRAISIGNPLGLEHTLTDGLISSRRTYAGRRYLQTSTPISPGNSGGPLFDDHGRVIGVSVAQVAGGLFGRAQNLNLAIPVDDLRTFIERTPEERPKPLGGGEPEVRPGSW